MDRAQFEAALLTNPFDNVLRARYADHLLAQGDANAALAQFDLLARQIPDESPPIVGQARALLQMGRREEAAKRYREARSQAGFQQDSRLEALAAPSTPAAGPRLTIVTGSKSDNVLEFAPVARERIGFSDIAGLDDLKRTVRLQIIEPFLNPGLFAKFKKRAGGGVMLYGPPGCGKTMIARAVATECNAEFMSVGISDVLNMYIGESQRNLAQFFDKARQSRPCVLFFDEIDALAFARSKAQSEHTRQVVNELLSQLDGFGGDNQGVLILAATNMPWDVDSAMKRPGRFSQQVFVPPPDEAARAHIVELKLRGVPHDAVDAKAIAATTRHFSGADIEGVVELAKDYALEDHLVRKIERNITQKDLLRATDAAKASTLDWLRTARNLVKYAGADDSYSDVERYLKQHRIV